VREKKEEGVFFARWMNRKDGERKHRITAGSKSSKVRRPAMGGGWWSGGG
jgi:hypothetical protein